MSRPRPLAILVLLGVIGASYLWALGVWEERRITQKEAEQIAIEWMAKQGPGHGYTNFHTRFSDIPNNAQYTIKFGSTVGLLGGDFSVHVDTRGKVRAFFDYRKPDNVSKPIPELGTKEGRRRWAMEKAKLLGLPSDAIFYSFEDNKAGAGRSGGHYTFSVRFRQEPNGYAFIGYGNSANYTFDGNGGELTFYSSRWDTQAERPNIQISEADAERRATSYHSERIKPKIARLVGPTELGYFPPKWIVDPTRLWIIRNEVAQLVYSVPVEGTTVLVDSESGDVLGYSRSLPRPRRSARRQTSPTPSGPPHPVPRPLYPSP